MRLATSTPILAVFLALLTWPGLDLHPQPGLDPSWNTGLHMAIHDHLRFGSDLIYSYGPLGFLTIPKIFYHSISLLAFIYLTLVKFSFCASLLWLLRRKLALLVAIIAVYLSAIVVNSLVITDVTVLGAFMWSIALLREELSSRSRRLFPLAMGLFAALTLLTKFNSGVLITVIAGLICLYIRPRGFRSLTIFVESFCLTFTMAWLATKNQIEDVIPWLVHSKEVATGYSSSMGITQANAREAHYLALGTLALVSVATFLGIRGLPLVRKTMIILVTSLLIFGALKHSFVRHDPGHLVTFFAVALIHVF
jgi:hypothetical protein